MMMVREAGTAALRAEELFEAWPVLSLEDRLAGFAMLPRAEAEELFEMLDARAQCELLLSLPVGEQRIWMRLLAPDDAADVVQEAEDEQQRRHLLDLLDEPTRKEVEALLAYAEDEAGGLMNPRFARLRPEMTVDAAISYLRRQRQKQVETIYYAYVLDAAQRLLGVVSLRELVTAPPGAKVKDVMNTDVISVPEDTDQEELTHLFAEHDLAAVPVLDEQGRMKGVITVDDIVDVVREEATEDMQKIGGTEALDAPYIQVGLLELFRKRVPWLAALVVLEFGSVLTMSGFEDMLQRVALLAMFIPLIVSCGGNSGSQASTLVVRAMALDEIHLRDWWRVIRRELVMGLMLGAMLGVIGMLLSLGWMAAMESEFSHLHQRVALTVGGGIVGVALWGTIAGAGLPFVLRSLRVDPACASGPFVATLVDATGMIIYLGIATVVLHDAASAAGA